MVDDWYDDIEDAKKSKRRAVVLGLLREAVGLYEQSQAPVTFRQLSIDFEDRTVTIDGRKYGPIEQRAFVIPLLDNTRAIMPSREFEPW